MTKPPVAPQKETQLTYHGESLTDPYFWLRDIKDPDTMKYIRAENRYTENVLKPLRKLQDKLFQDLRATINENDVSVPVSKGSWLYFSRVRKGLQYPIYYRKTKKGGKSQLILDCNLLARGKKYFSLGVWSISPDQNWLAFGVDFSGNETYIIHFKNLISGKTIRKKIEKAAGDLVWAHDNRTVYYTELDDNHRPHRVLRTQIDTIDQHETVYLEEDQKHFLSLGKTSDEEWILISSAGMVTSEVWFGSSRDSKALFTCVDPRREGREYNVDSHDGLFYIRTNDQALNFRLMVTPIHQHEAKNWVEFISEDPDGLLKEFLLFKNFLVLHRYKKALPDIQIYNFEKEKYSSVSFQQKAFALSLGAGNEEFQSKYLRMVIQSPVMPETTVDFDMASGRRKVLKQTKVKNYKNRDYRCERAQVRSHDGKQIPVTIFYRKGFKKDSQPPVLLYGYGAYGHVLQPTFNRLALPLLKRGFAYAIAHVRGGQELGRSWYEDGKFLKKKNTFLDFISVADWLIANKWTRPEKLAIMGGSAGGLLMGAAINMRPELFRVCVAHVPFVDVVNTMFDETLPLTKVEYKEWGDPNIRAYYQYIKSYSPYDNVGPKRYPNLLVTGGLHDFRVTYWEPTKWMAKLRDQKVGDETLLLKIKTSAGHFGASGRFDHLKEEAEALAFIIRYLDLPLK